MIPALDGATGRATRSGKLGPLLMGSFLVLAVAVAACSSKTPAQLASEALNAGLKAHAAGNLDEASKQYKECLKQEPSNKYCNYNLGLIAQTQGRMVEAENYYRLSLATDPNYPPAIFNLAIVRTKAGAPQDAIALYRQYVQLKPNEAGGHLNLGLLLIATGDKVEGDKEIAKATALDPKIQVPASSPAASASGKPAASSSPAP